MCTAEEGNIAAAAKRQNARPRMSQRNDTGERMFSPSTFECL